jgi:DNA-binding CsgD family transcriptional regulator
MPTSANSPRQRTLAKSPLTHSSAVQAAAAADPAPTTLEPMSALHDAFAFRVVGHLRGADMLAERLGAMIDNKEICRVVGACVRLWTAHSRGDLATGVDAAEVVAEGLRSGTPPLVRCVSLTSLVLAHDLLDRQHTSGVLIETAWQCATEEGLDWLLPIIGVVDAAVASTLGGHDRVVVAATRTIAAAGRTGSQPLLPMAYSLLAWAQLHTDERSAALTSLRHAEAGFLAGDCVGLDLFVRARVEAFADRPDEGVAECLQTWDHYDARGAVTHVVALGPTAVRLALATGDRDGAQCLVERSLAAALRTEWKTVHAVARWIRGIADSDVEQLQTVAGELSCLHRGLLARDVRADIDRLVRRPARNRLALTNAERNVFALLRTGLSNRDIAAALVVSLRTVETHLTSVYRKLGVVGRTQALASLTVTGTEPRTLEGVRGSRQVQQARAVIGP